MEFFCFSLFIYKLTQWRSVENIVLYHKNITKTITIWHTVVGISGSGVCGFVVCVVGVWGCQQALNRLKINILFWRKNDLNEDNTFRSGTIINGGWIQKRIIWDFWSLASNVWVHHREIQASSHHSQKYLHNNKHNCSFVT